MIFSSLVWLTLVVRIVGILYGIAALLFVLVAHALFVVIYSFVEPGFEATVKSGYHRQFHPHEEAFTGIEWAELQGDHGTPPAIVNRLCEECDPIR